MKLSRRKFLGGVLAVTVASQVQAEGLFAPTLVGDGVTDDTKALQALLDGDPVWIDGEWVENAFDIRLSGGRFLISETLHIRRDNIRFSGAEIAMDEAVECATVFKLHNGVRGTVLEDLIVSTRSSGAFYAPRRNGAALEFA
jgi:hypothetical protein